MFTFFFFFLWYGAPRDLHVRTHSFPSRRSSDLPSTSGDLGLDLLGLRLNGAQLGAMLDVSRQAVSAAVKRGTISPPGPDGLFDAKRAVREWMTNSNPDRKSTRLNSSH